MKAPPVNEPSRTSPVDPAFILEIATRLATGDEIAVTRLRMSHFFLYFFEDGDDAVVSDEMRREIEIMAGEPLQEFIPDDYPGETALRFRADSLPSVRAALASIVVGASSTKRICRS
jgi:hypothetical protein